MLDVAERTQNRIDLEPHREVHGVLSLGPRRALAMRGPRGCGFTARHLGGVFWEAANWPELFYTEKRSGAWRCQAFT